jgi:hypothetical protein
MHLPFSKRGGSKIRCTLMKCPWETGEEVMNWWIYGTEKKHELEGQIDLFEEVET